MGSFLKQPHGYAPADVIFASVLAPEKKFDVQCSLKTCVTVFGKFSDTFFHTNECR